MVFKIPANITPDICPYTYMQFAAEKAHGVLSPAMIERYKNEIASTALIVLAMARINTLSNDCEKESRTYSASGVDNLFFKKIADAFSVVGESFLSLSHYLRGEKEKNSNSSQEISFFKV